MKSGLFIFMLCLILVLSTLFAYSGIRYQQLLLTPEAQAVPIEPAFFETYVLLHPVGIFVFTGLLVLLTAGLGYLGLMLFTRPLNKLHHAMISVSNGDYETKLKVKGRQGLAQLYAEFNKMVKNFRKKLAMQKYLSKSTMNMIDNLKTGEYSQEPERKKITILFSDVRGFTAYAEENDAFHVVLTINEIFNIQVEIILKHEGDIDKFVGDEIMATFPDPSSAFKAACAIQKKIKQYNKKSPAPLPIGIGINYGEAVVGAIGGADALDWTSIGKTVNEAARLCSLAPGGAIYLTESAFEEIRTSRSYTIEELQVKGIKNKVKIYAFEA